MKKYDRGWASLETGAALLIVMLLIAWGAGIWQDYIQTKGWQTEARLVSNWTSAARSYIGKTTRLSRAVVPQQLLPLSRQPC